MKAKMKQLLEELRNRVRVNLDAVHHNESEVRQLLTEPNSKERSEKLSNRLSLSKMIIEENGENIQIQNQIIKFLIRFKEVPDFAEKIRSLKGYDQELNEKSDKDLPNATNNAPNTEQDLNKSKHSVRIEGELKGVTERQSTNKLFEQTIAGDLDYNTTHPLFNNQEFFERLLNYYLQLEEYEICAELQKFKPN